MQHFDVNNVASRKSGALLLKAARRNAIDKLKSFSGFKSELQTNPVPFI